MTESLTDKWPSWTGYRCAKCNGPSNMYGHYTKFCRQVGFVKEQHFCCPDNCELGNVKKHTHG